MAMFVEGQDPLVQANGPGSFTAPVVAPDLVLEEDGPGGGTLILMLLAMPVTVQQSALYRAAIRRSHDVLTIRALTTLDSPEQVVDYAVAVCLVEWHAALTTKPGPAFNPFTENPIEIFGRMGAVEVALLRQRSGQKAATGPATNVG